MQTRRFAGLVAALVLAGSSAACEKTQPGGGGAGGSGGSPTEVTTNGGATGKPGGMAAFRSEKELVEYLKQRAAPARARGAAKAEASPPPAAAPAAQAAADSPSTEGESVTNVQHAGVDEGGIVKVHGDHLVVLRRGRLFTINVGDDALTPVSTVDDTGPTSIRAAPGTTRCSCRAIRSS